MLKSKLLYNLYKNDKLPTNVKNRCCNFILLEEKCKECKHYDSCKTTYSFFGNTVMDYREFFTVKLGINSFIIFVPFSAIFVLL